MSWPAPVGFTFPRQPVAAGGSLRPSRKSLILTVVGGVAGPGHGGPDGAPTEDRVLTAQIQPGGSSAQRAASATVSRTPEHLESSELLDHILSSLDDDSAQEVVTIDLRGKSPVADHMVVASGRSSRHVTAIAEKLMERLKQGQGLATRSEGKDSGDWVLIDAGDVIVHVFRPEVREFYQLEKMWQTPAEAAERHS